MPESSVAAKSRTAKSRAAKPAPRKPAARAPAKPEKKEKKAKVKVVRDSFTMPQDDYAKIAELKAACQKAGLQVKKSELLRAGLHALSILSVEKLKQTIARVEQIKTGRPKKG